MKARRRFNRILKRPFDPDFAFLKYFSPPPNTVFVDVGANVGESVEAMRLYHPSMPIVAFEPGPTAFKTLQETVGRLKDVTVHNMALAESAGEFVLYTPTYANWPISTLASTIREEASGWIPNYAGLFVKADKIGLLEEVVKVETLDSYNLVPSFLKADVQGAEASLLRGAMRTLEKHRPLLLMEQSPDDGIIDVIGPLGYRPFRFVDGQLLSGAEGFSNAVYITDRHREQLNMPIE